MANDDITAQADATNLKCETLLKPHVLKVAVDMCAFTLLHCIFWRATTDASRELLRAGRSIRHRQGGISQIFAVLVKGKCILSENA